MVSARRLTLPLTDSAGVPPRTPSECLLRLLLQIPRKSRARRRGRPRTSTRHGGCVHGSAPSLNLGEAALTAKTFCSHSDPRDGAATTVEGLRETVKTCAALPALLSFLACSGLSVLPASTHVSLWSSTSGRCCWFRCCCRRWLAQVRAPMDRRGSVRCGYAGALLYQIRPQAVSPWTAKTAACRGPSIRVKSGK